MFFITFLWNIIFINDIRLLFCTKSYYLLFWGENIVSSQFLNRHQWSSWSFDNIRTLPFKSLGSLQNVLVFHENIKKRILWHKQSLKDTLYISVKKIQTLLMTICPIYLAIFPIQPHFMYIFRFSCLDFWTIVYSISVGSWCVHLCKNAFSCSFKSTFSVVREQKKGMSSLLN